MPDGCLNASTSSNSPPYSIRSTVDTISLQTKKKINTMASFILFVYIKFWFSYTSLTRAATNDIQLYKQITTFKRVDKNVSGAALVVLQRHTWYLTEDCISIALFNPDLEDDEKNKLARKIGELPTTQLEIRKPTLPTVSARSKIPDFVGQRSILLFSLLKMDHKFFLQENWKETDKYDAARKAISNLYPVNGPAERALSMATTFNGRITKDEDSFQNLLLVVEGQSRFKEVLLSVMIILQFLFTVYVIMIV